VSATEDLGEGSCPAQFHHDNEERNESQSSFGYGSGSGSDAYPLIEANTFLANVHSIVGDGTARTGYLAYDNIFLSKVISGSGGDVDMHGTGGGSSHVGGNGGTEVEVARNTFLRTGKPNFDLRGTPCSGAIDHFHDNVALQGLHEAVSWWAGFTLPPFLQASGKFDAPNPTQKFGVGDFDGDGDDRRFLSAKTQTIDQLLFGDFDGDGRTDVFTQIGNVWMVSWGGISPWQKINESTARMKDFAIGDFVGDRRSDVFFARGDQWFVSDGGVGPFVPYATSSKKITELRFGDFDGDGKTDVLGVVDDQWMVVYANQEHTWKPLGPQFFNTVDGLIVADFDGNGRADIATSSCSIRGCEWKVSYDGKSDWATLRSADRSLSEAAAIGRFDGKRAADVLLWHNDYLDIATGGAGAPQRHSRQDMR